MSKKLIENILSRRNELMYHSLQELTSCGKELMERARSGPLDNLQVEAFALVCEVAKNVVNDHPGMRATQIMAGIALHEGKFVEMQNGEGKTLAATMPAYLNTFKEQHVHIATYNDYLARRDALWMGPIYAALGLTVGVVVPGEQYRLQYAFQRDEQEDEYTSMCSLLPCTRQNAYACNVVYGTHTDFIMDYLLDNLVQRASDVVQGGHLDYLILDEADSVLIDKANEMPRIVRKLAINDAWYHRLLEIALQLQEPKDYLLSRNWSTTIELTLAGIARAEALLRQANLLEQDVPLYSAEAAGLAEQIVQSLRAIHIYKRDQDYIVVDGCVLTVDFYTGRAEKNTPYPGGLQQAIEAKEGVALTERSRTTASISYQHFFKLYKKTAGMTATAREHRPELLAVYNKRVVEIPPFASSRRKDEPDRIYRTQQGRLEALLEEIEERYQSGRGRPLLVNTMSIEMADSIGQSLSDRGIPCQVLHARHARSEAEIIARAGKRGTVTIAAKMAGRGTDILLDAEAEQLGGLHVIGVERYETRYMDRQLIGRAGRQGKPGSSQFFTALDDQLMHRFGGERVSRYMQFAGLGEDMPLESGMVSRLIQQAQARTEGGYFESRRKVYLRDRLLDRQRRSVYEIRHKIVLQEDISVELETIRQNFTARCRQKYLRGRDRRRWKIRELSNYLRTFSGRFRPGDFSTLWEQSAKKAQQDLATLLKQAYDAQRKAADNDVAWIQQERATLLRHLDHEWSLFLTRLNELQEENSIRSFVGEDEFSWYAVESFKAFQETMERIEENFLKEMFQFRPVVPTPATVQSISDSQTPQLSQITPSS